MRESARFLPCAWRWCSCGVDLKGEPRRLRVAPRYSAACEEGRRDERVCGTLPKRRWRHQQRARRADGAALTASSGLTPEPPPSSVGSCVVGVGRGQCGRKRERRRRAAETSQPIRGELHRPTSGRAGDDSAAHPDRPHSASTPEPTNLGGIATKNLATPIFPGTRRIVVVAASPRRTRWCRIARLISFFARVIATLVDLGSSSH